MNRPARPRRGSFLIEMLVLTVIFAAALLITAQTITAANRTSSAARRALDLGQRVDTALDLLRRDAWAASALEARSDTRLQLTHPDGSTITWDLSASGDLTRTAADTRAWHNFPPLRFKVRGPLLHVEFLPADLPGAGSESITLPSQQLLASAGGPSR